MTVGELFTRMDSREFAYWQAYHRYYEPIGGEWEQTGLAVAATLAPYCPRGRTPKPRDFIPTEKPPQHRLQIEEEFEKIRRAMAGE